MAAYRPLDPLRPFTDALGQILAGGTIAFYDTLTLDAKSVYSDEDLSVDLGNTVTLDAAGFLPSDVWTSDACRVRVFNSDDELVAEADPIQEQGAAGSAIPSQTGHAGEALFTNGAVMSWGPVVSVPDMTGHEGEILSNASGVPIWIPQPDAPDVPAGGIEVTVSTQKVVRIGDMQILSGTATMPISGTHTSSLAVVFSPAFNAAPWYIGCTNTTGGITPSGAQGTITAQGQSATGFTINLDVNIDSVDAGWNINAGAVVQWTAIGPVTP